MKTKELIDDLLKRGKIQDHEHIALQLSLAYDKILVIPDDKECEEWYELNIGIKNDCSASSAIYKYKTWLIERLMEEDSFVCKACNCKVPANYCHKTEGYCYLCDPNLTEKDYKREITFINDGYSAIITIPLEIIVKAAKTHPDIDVVRIKNEKGLVDDLLWEFQHNEGSGDNISAFVEFIDKMLLSVIIRSNNVHIDEL